MALTSLDLCVYEYGEGERLLYRMPARKIRLTAFRELAVIYDDAGGDTDALSRLDGMLTVVDKWRAVVIEHIDRYEHGTDTMAGDALRARLEEGTDEAAEGALGALMRRLFFRPEGIVGIVAPSDGRPEGAQA